jgi:hypothetical protein
MVAARAAMDDEGGRPFDHAVAIGHQPASFDVEIDLGTANPGAHAILSPDDAAEFNPARAGNA